MEKSNWLMEEIEDNDGLKCSYCEETPITRITAPGNEILLCNNHAKELVEHLSARHGYIFELDNLSLQDGDILVAKNICDYNFISALEESMVKFHSGKQIGLILLYGDQDLEKLSDEALAIYGLQRINQPEAGENNE